MPCQNCKQPFPIDDRDQAFYAKLRVPPPTFCPACRMQRRMTARNERVLYKRTCSLCKKEIISIHPQEVPFPVYCAKCYWSDSWDPVQFGREYDFSKPFFVQFKALQDQVPRVPNVNYAEERMVNSEYVNCAGDMKNCYLVFGALKDEDCYYDHYINDSKDCVDNLYCFKSERCYECFDIEGCYGLQYGYSCVQCSDSLFLYDCRNCSNCIGCVGLRNQSYHILNQKYSKEEYEKKKAELKLDTYDSRMRFRDQFMREKYYSIPRKFYHGLMNSDFSGDYIAYSEATLDSFYTKQARGCRYMFWAQKAQDVYDYYAWGDVEFSYEIGSCGDNSYGLKFTNMSWSNVKDLEYCSNCFNRSSDLFGCIGLRGKKFCVLNNQYTEAEYRALREKIIAHMNQMPYTDKQGLVYRYGEYFPIELSHHNYNEATSQAHFPLTREQAEAKGYPWLEVPRGEYQITKKSDDLPQTINEVKDDIKKDTIACGDCGKPYRIIAQELAFYRKQSIPLPRACPDCRHEARVKLRNPLNLWRRTCSCDKTEHFHGTSKCPTEFKTAYAPERPDTVYCEECYNAKIA